MSLLHAFIFLDRIGFTLIHFLITVLWQSTILLAAVGILVFLLRHRGENIRHILLVSALLIMPLLPVFSQIAHIIGAPQHDIAVLPTYKSVPDKVFPPPDNVQTSQLPEVPPNETRISSNAEDNFPSVVPYHDPIQSTRKKISLFDFPWMLALAGYLIVIIFFMLAILAGRIRIRQWIEYGDAVTDEKILDIFERARNRLGLKREVAIIESPEVVIPFTLHTFSPVVLLPANFARSLSLIELEGVALHELAHVKRNDPFIFTVISLLRAVFFFQPLVWAAVREATCMAECSCDIVATELNGETNSYARLLSRLVDNLPGRIISAESEAGFLFSRSVFLRRVETILYKRKQIRKLSYSILAGAFLSGMVSLTVALAFPLGYVHEIGENTFVPVLRKSIQSFSEIVADAGSISLENVQVLGEDHKTGHSETVHRNKRTKTSGLSLTGKTNDGNIIPKDDMNTQSDSQGISNNSLASSGPEQKSDAQLTPFADVPASFALAPNPVSVSNGNVQAGGTDEITGWEMKEKKGSYSAFVKPEPSELKISPGFGNNPLPSPTISEQLTGLVSLSENFQSIPALDKRARSLHYISTSSSQLDPVWSPDGKKIAFTDGKYGVWVVPSEGGEPVLVYDNYFKSQWKGIKFHSVGSMDTFSFSPDGQSLLFQYYVIDENRGTKVTVIKDKFGNVTGYNVDGIIPFIMSVNIDTGEIKTVREEAEKGRYSTDGKYFGFINYDHHTLTNPSASFHSFDMTLIDTSNGEIRYLTDGQYRIKNFCFAPDNTAVYVCMTPKDNSAETGLYRIPIHGGKAEKIPLKLADESCSDLQFSENGEWLIYTEMRDGRKNIIYYDILTGAQHCKALQISTKSVSLSPDGKKFCSVIETSETKTSYHLFTSASLTVPAGVETIAPMGFAIRGNFPNPFNQSTVIEYTLPDAGRVSLEIYNVLGQKIRQLVSETVQPGFHKIRWDGRTDNGNIVSSGTYIMRLSMGKFIVTKNMTMIK
jgi:beta-lactamase regulating signal transducer with metallopeptidase domain/Tol biopolymer transport system component